MGTNHCHLDCWPVSQLLRQNRQAHLQPMDYLSLFIIHHHSNHEAGKKQVLNEIFYYSLLICPLAELGTCDIAG